MVYFKELSGSSDSGVGVSLGVIACFWSLAEVASTIEFGEN
jgi:hypothetical protein